ncbi:uncharacterized protein LOC116767471 isoform X2 [Danaus plexippus]|nr:uncharacterized protein LOC116767471 isoform X2 [Danaus plexippus]
MRCRLSKDLYIEDPSTLLPNRLRQPSSATKLPEFVRQDTCEDGEKPVVSSAEDPADTCHNLSTASTLPTELLANRTADLPTLAQTRRSFLDIAERGARTTSLPDSIRK